MLRSAAFCLLLPALVSAQAPRAVPRFGLVGSGLSSAGAVRPWAVLADAGARAAVVGTESGRLDVWAWPRRVARDVRLSFRLDGEAWLAGAELARQVVARPEGSTIVYSHPAFTVRQHILVPLDEPGVLILLEAASTRPLEVLVRARADVLPDWPGLPGGGSVEWQSERQRLHITQAGVREHYALLGSPGAQNGAAQSAHDVDPTSQFTVRIDPAATATTFIPIVVVGSAVRDSAERVYDRLQARAALLWREKAEHFGALAEERLSLETPDVVLNRAVAWSVVRLDQQLRGMAAINATSLSVVGQFERARTNLRLLSRQQQPDGAIPCDVPATLLLPRPQEENRVPPVHDAGAFWILASYAYWTGSGDGAFIREQWPALQKAFRKGALDAAQVTSITSAGVLAAAFEVVPALAQVAGDARTAAEAVRALDRAINTIEQQYWLERPGLYAPATPALPGQDTTSGSVSPNLTAWPAPVLAAGLLEDTRANRMLREMGSLALTADWGVRARSSYDRSYDARHQLYGAVRPDLTGSLALAHYRYHRAWAGHDLVRALARMSFDFGRGLVPQTLSGSFYTLAGMDPLESISSTAPLITAVVNGLLGLRVDAPNRALSIEPHLPTEWDGIIINAIRLGNERLRVEIRREPGRFVASVRRDGNGPMLFLRLAPALPLGARVARVRVNDQDAPVQVEESARDSHAVVEVQLLADAEIEIEYEGGFEVQSPVADYQVGDASDALRILDLRREGADIVLLVEGRPAVTYPVVLRSATRVRSVVGAELVQQTTDRIQLRVRFAASPSPFARREIRIRT